MSPKHRNSVWCCFGRNCTYFGRNTGIPEIPEYLTETPKPKLTAKYASCLLPPVSELRTILDLATAKAKINGAPFDFRRVCDYQGAISLKACTRPVVISLSGPLGGPY